MHGKHTRHNNLIHILTVIHDRLKTKTRHDKRWRVLRSILLCLRERVDGFWIIDGDFEFAPRDLFEGVGGWMRIMSKML